MKNICRSIFLIFVLTFAPVLKTAAQKVVRGPFLQVATENSMIIKWRTNQKVLGKVEYGLTKDNLDKTKSASDSNTDHEVQLTNLKANTRYFYRIADVDSNPNLDLQFFETSPPSGQVQPFKVWVVGDAGTANDKIRATRDAFYEKHGKESADLMIMLGDNAYSDGLDHEYQAAVFEDMFEELLYNTPVWPTPGNHDLRTGLNSPYYDIFTLPTRGEAGGVASGDEQYYSYDYSNVHFISMNSQDIDTSPGSPMYEWLEEDLASNTQPWIIAYWHHPPYSWGSHDSDVGGTETRTREDLVPLLEAHGVDLVMNGHSHSYERSFMINGHYGTSDTFKSSMKIDGGNGQEDGDGAYQKIDTEENKAKGAVYTVAGSSGKTSLPDVEGIHPVMLNKLMRIGSVVLEIDDNVLDFSFLMDDGTVGDHFTLMKERTGNKSPKFTSTPVEIGTEHEFYSYQVSAEDPEDDEIVFSALELPSWLIFDPASGTLSGTPGDLDIGKQSVTIGAYDGTSTASQSFEIEVANVNDLPTFVSTPTWGTSEEVEYIYEIEAFDPDPSDDLEIHLIDGPIWLTYNQNRDRLQGEPALGDQGLYTVILSLLDGVSTDTVYQTFQIEVLPFNYPPDFISEPAVEVIEGDFYSYQLELTDQNGDSIYTDITRLPEWLTFHPISRMISGRPDDPAVGNNRVEILATDSLIENPVRQRFTIKVINVNDAPIVVSQPQEYTQVDERFEYYIEVEDPDHDEDDVEFEWNEIPDWLSYRKSNKRFRGTPDQSHVGYWCIEGSFTDGELEQEIPYSFCFFVVDDLNTVSILSQPNLEGTEDLAYCYEVGLFIPDFNESEPVLLTEIPSWLTYDPIASNLCGTPEQGDVGTQQIDLIFAIGTDTVSQSFDLEVVEVNDTPIYLSQSISSYEVQEETFFETIFEFTDEENDSIIFELGEIPAWLAYQDSTIRLFGTPAQTDLGSYNVEFRYKDNRQSEFTNGSFVINVTEVNERPVFDSEPILAVKEDSLYNYPVQFSDRDLNAQLDFQVIQMPAWLTFQDGSFSLIGVPSNDDVGIHLVLLSVSDGIAEPVLQEFLIEVVNVNDPVVLLSKPLQETLEDEPYTYQLQVQEIDLNDLLVVEVLTKPSWLSFDQVSNSFQGTPTNDHVGIDSVHLTLRDLYMDEPIQQKFVIDVANVNDKPQFLNNLDTLLSTESAFSFTYQAFDVDLNDEVSLTFDGLPVWVEYVDSVSTIKFAAADAEDGVYEWTVIATDLVGSKNKVFSVLRIEKPTAIQDFDLTSKITVFPNPMEGIINFKIQGIETSYFAASLMSINGKALESKVLRSSNDVLTWDLKGDYAAGTYIVRLSSQDGLTGQFLIQAK